MSGTTGCPDPEQLAGVMTSDQRSSWIDHAASCNACRWIAAVMDVLPEPPRAPEVAAGTQVGRYLLAEVIGRGAMGVVHAARDPALDRHVAVKLLRLHASPERLRREARALARLSHPNVVQVHDVGEHDGQAFVAMELVDGRDLRRWLSEPRSVEATLHVLVQAGRGLAAAHDAGLIHRDFKPDNVLIARDGRVLVGDFGLARSADLPRADPAAPPRADGVPLTALTATGAAIGTPAYMAPEQVDGEASAASDQYAFCVTAWEALFGRRPYVGATLSELRAAAQTASPARPPGPQVPRQIEAALRRGLAANAAARFPSMTALLHALPAVAARRRPRRLAAVGLGLAAATVAVVAAVMAARGSRASASRDECEREGDALSTTWNPGRARLVAAAGGGDAALGLDRWATAWRAGRIDACRAAARHEIAPAVLASRVACYETARSRFEVTVDGALARPHAAATGVSTLPSVAPCASNYADVGPRPGPIEVRPCRCPYSACADDGSCPSVCRARAFRVEGPIPEVSVLGRMEVLVGVSLDGETLLYIAGDSEHLELDEPATHCRQNHLFLARHRGERYVPIELTEQLAAFRDVLGKHLRCTLAPDAASIVCVGADGRRVIRFELDGDRLVRPDEREFAAIAADLPAGHTILRPFLSADQLTFYFHQQDGDRQFTARAATRATRGDAFTPSPLPTAFGITRTDTEFMTGVSSDDLSMFVESEYTTRVMVRSARDQPFAELYGDNRMVMWHAIPAGDCDRVFAVMSPGGCQAQQIVLLRAAFE